MPIASIAKRLSRALCERRHDGSTAASHDGQKQSVRRHIKTVQFGWPLGMPVVDHVDREIRKVRTRPANWLARVLFVLEGREMVLLHGLIKKEVRRPSPILSWPASG